jgi:hypothetical protein
MKVTSITVGIPVSDLRVARWYQRVLELDRGMEPAPSIREFEVSPGCWLQLKREAGASGSGHVFRVGVEDIDEARRRLLGSASPSQTPNVSRESSSSATSSTPTATV